MRKPKPRAQHGFCHQPFESTPQAKTSYCHRAKESLLRPYGYLRVEIKSAVAHLEDKDGNHIIDLDVAKFINRATQSDICERIEAKYQAAKAHPADDFDDFDRGA